MSYKCTNCTFIGNSVNELCRHLRIIHSFYEGSQLNLQCCFSNCSSVFKTYSGFRKHLVKCKLNIEKVCAVDNSTEIRPNNFRDNSQKNLNTNNNEFNTNTDKNLNTNNNELNTNINEDLSTNNCADYVNLSDIIEDDFSDSMLIFVQNLYSFGIPDSSLDKILRCTSQLVSSVFEKILDNVDESNVICWQIVSTFLNSFEMYLTKHKRQKIYEKQMVKPIEKSCGHRMEQRFDSQLRIYKTVPLTCTFTYVPIIETLKFLFQNSSFKKIMFDSFNNKILNCNRYNNLADGEMYKTNKLFHNSKQLTIQIQIFFDDFEICNPLGSKTLSHKIGGFYFSICNLPFHFNSNLNNIHLLALCYSEDIKNFGINSVLEVIVKDLRILETEGFYIEGVKYPIKGTLAVLSHDNLGGSMLYGMVESFQANFFCRICLMHKDLTKICCKQDDTLLRTPESFQNHIKLVINHPNGNEYGIKSRSVLNNLEFFKFGINLSADIMHDFLEGICQLELKLFLKFLIQEKLTSIEEINAKIFAFDYGLQNRANKPSPICLDKTGHLIGQTAAQTYCLLIFFPLIISDITQKLDYNTNYNKWKVILLLVEIVKIAFAPKLHDTLVADLENLIEHHHKLFLSEYSTHLTPKHHIITHLPAVIKRMGPPRHFWTMRFESKHGYLKDLSKKLKNYKNVCKTLAYRHQQEMLFKWNNCNIFQCFPLLKKYNVITIENTTYFHIISKFLNLKSDVKICSGISVELFGVQIEVNNFICTSFNENWPNFSKVLFLFIYDSKSYAVCQSYKTLSICKKYIGYMTLKDNNDYFVLCLSQLKHFKSYKMYEKDHTNVLITDYFICP